MEGLKRSEAKLDTKTKTLYISAPKTDFVPSYLYYLCERQMERQPKTKIETVVFRYSRRSTYTLAQLRGVHDWSDIKYESK